MNELNFRTLDLNLLRVFDEVMAERNLTRAASNLSMTQPAVSNTLSQLRHTLSPGRFEPATATQHLVLAMADATASKIMPGLVQLLDREAPGVTLRVLPLTTRDPRDLLEGGEVHLAIGHFPGVLAEMGASHLQGQALVHRPLPLEMPPVCVDMLWHRQTQAASPHAWLRETVWRAVALETA